MKSFNEIYTNICTENYQSIHKLREKHLMRSFFIALIFILISIPVALNFSLLLALAFDAITTIVIFFNPYFNNYGHEYKNNIISSLVKNYDKNLNFNVDGGIARTLFEDAAFESFNEFHSSDYIYGTINNTIPFQMCDLHTLLVSRDEEGHIYRNTTFKGLFSAIPLEHTVPTAVQILSERKIVTTENTDPTRVNMDSQEFEKYFNVFSVDKNLAMRILTSDLMDFLLEEKNKMTLNLT